MAVWLGGLLLVLVEIRGATAASVRRFSALALGMVVILVATGSLQAFRQLGSFDALTDTTYGTVLIRKLVVVVMLIAVAFVSRRIVRREPVDMPRLGRSIAIEAIAAVAIVVFTSLLMASNPSNVVASKPFSVTLIDGDYLASITVEPSRVGSNEMHLYLSDAVSSLVQPDSVTVEISDPSRDVAALQIPVTRSGAGHFTTSTATFPYATTWTLTVTARYNTFDEVQFTTEVRIR
jgi:copper transport protein